MPAAPATPVVGRAPVSRPPAAAAKLAAISGKVFSDRGDTPAGVKLRFYRQQFGGRKALVGEAVTGADGSYQLEAGEPADIQVYAVGADGKEHPLGGAGNVVIPAAKLPKPQAEYARLLASVQPHLGGGKLGDAREDDERQDLALLHKATKWDGRLLALAATAEELAETVGVTPQVAYGLLRAGLPSHHVQLARIGQAGIGHALRKAVEAGVVELNERDIANAQTTLGAFGRTTRRKLAVNGTASSYGSMLSASGLSAAEQDRFDEVFTAHSGDAATLWRNVRDAGLPADQLRLTAQLGALTLNSARLTESLRTQVGTPERLAETLVGAKLYQPAAWADRLSGLAGGNERVLGQMIPTAYQGKTVAERLAAYTADLAFKVRRSYPTQVLSDRIRSGELASEAAVAQDVATVLDRAAGAGFVPGQQPLSRFLSERRETVFAGMPAERAKAATAEVATLTRQYQITASDEALGVLQRHDLRSAAQISAMPQRVFLAKYAADFPSVAEAELTWRRAQQVTAVTLNLVALTKQLDSARLLPAMAQPSDVVGGAQADLVKQFPTLESLFGSLDYCECAHCRSVLSPAAYLVDLLKFLDDAPALPKSPYVALTERRPDLPHLPLTCENTNVALPYIDVVNEILEFFLAHNAQLTPDAAYDTGEASSEDLIAEPQNLLPVAYDLLKQAQYPLTAPFDLWLATVRTFVEHFEVRFADVLDVLRMSDELHPATGYGLAAVAYERLGSSPAELALLTAADPLATWPARYGYAPNAAPAVWGELANARTLARKLGVTYRELVSLLRTKFIRPLVLADPPGAASCSWEETTLRRAGGSAAEPIDYLLLNQFVRIWRRLGWSIDETDQALMTFLPVTPDPRTAAAIGAATGSALLGIARLIQLAQLLGARPSERRELLVLWAPLTDARYEQLFLTGTTQIRDAAFEGAPGGYLTAPGVLLADHLEPVLAALRLSNADNDAILRHSGLDPAVAELTMANVSLLHRHAVLARMLKIKIPELLTLIDLTGLDPFAETVRFVETVHRLEASGLSATDADFLVRHRFDPVGPLRTNTQPPLALVRALAAEVTRIRTEFAIPSDPLTFTDDVVARALALVLDADVAAAFLAAWTGRAPLPAEVFQQHLLRQVIAGVGEVGFLDASDPAILFTMPGGDQAADRNRRERLAQTLLPYIQQRLTRQAVVDAVAAGGDADPALVESLLTQLGNLDAYLAASTYGLTVAADRTTGYLELPPGHYQFTAACAEAGTTATLTFDHLSDPVLSTGGALVSTAEVELRGAVAYGFTLTHTPGAKVTLSVRGQRLTTTPVSGLTTYRRTETEQLHQKHLLLTKALLLASRLSLNEAEFRLGTLDLGALPTVEDLTPADVTVRFGQLLRVIDYVRLRDELAADPADLLNIFARAQRSAPADEVFADVTALTARMVRREPEAVRAAAGLLGLTAAGFADERGLTRLWRVLALAARIGVGPAELGRWATPSPDRAVAQDVQSTVKAKYSAEAWRRVAQPIFDKLRKQRRDALVAQVLQVTGYQRVEQLFEHFLVDPATEPVVHTSRLRLAISSVQTFIQRCLLNLENDVSPSSINADYWEWMKRYRVWEANRKIFLWPENWLEPEFRDDKTHLFAALESALLESDLGRDAVERAFFEYLHGLDEIARLSVRTIYLERKQDRAANVLHVIGRTGGAPHKYFYRTWSRRSWTPWTPVTASIDGDHLAMVMWQGRVHLFWVVFLPKPEPKGSSSPQNAGNVPLSELAALRPRRKVEAQLFWSCYTPAGAGPGEWSDPVMAIAEEPLVKTVNDDFDASKVFIWADVLGDGSVSISLLGQGADQAFRVISKHAPPVHNTAYREPLEPPYLAAGDVPLTRAGQGRWRGAAPKFRVHVEGETITDNGVNPCDITEDIFAKAPSTYDLVIVPPPAKLTKGSTKGGGKGGQQSQNRPEDPFFYMDTAHNFFVEPTWLEFSINDGDQALAAQPPVWREFDHPEYWKDRPIVATFPDHWLDGDDVPVKKPVDVITRPNAVVRFNGGIVGRAGRVTEGRILRTGPHGAPILSNRELS
ncbi:neuraminidase-like domain-containing protein [Allorhizocola rhizosphaerae]|uniref:neuraminidase-like domain-containing protein n=1 Tax=Allorhizocola rhizosphaerae TaxID=1872709 RepID=UPI001B8BE2E7|nr:neuraminidase-like domain-containing protein [Allorhizocola rhizosphaerae]